MRITVLPLLCLALLALVVGPAGADQLLLENGSVLTGTVLQQGDKYWYKSPDGDTKMIPASEVKQWVKGGAASVSGGGGNLVRGGGSAEYLTARQKAEACYVAKDALAIWREFIDTHANSPDLAAAQAERDRWQALADSDSEKINGRWIGGAERRAIVDKALAMAKEAGEDMRANRTLAAVEKFKQVIRIYPNDYAANYALGYLMVIERRAEEAVPYFEQCVRLRPDAAGPLNNLAVALFESRKCDRAAALFLQAAQKQDDAALARNLVTAAALAKRVQQAPQVQQVSPGRLKEIAAAAELLAAKYSIDPPREAREVRWYFEPPVRRAAGGNGGGGSPGGPGGEALPGGVVGSGSGFIISTDGLILTNRHVAAAGDKLTVQFHDGSKQPAEVVVIDKVQDLALIRVKPAEGQRLSFLNLAKADVPAEGAQCFVLGYPLVIQIGATLKVTQGIVSGVRGRIADGSADVLVDAKVNPGNSGGPLLDKHCQVIGIVTMKTSSTEIEDSYGIAIGAGKIRKFLDANHVTVASTDNETVLSAEQVVAAAKDATVCVFIGRDGRGK